MEIPSDYGDRERGERRTGNLEEGLLNREFLVYFSGQIGELFRSCEKCRVELSSDIGSV